MRIARRSMAIGAQSPPLPEPTQRETNEVETQTKPRVGDSIFPMETEVAKLAERFKLRPTRDASVTVAEAERLTRKGSKRGIRRAAR